MAPFAQSLNSSDVFVLHNPHACFMWVGKGSIGDERECAREVLGRISKPDADLVTEGNEPQTFWQMLGGKADYGSAKQIWVSFFESPNGLLCRGREKGRGEGKGERGKKALHKAIH